MRWKRPSQKSQFLLNYFLLVFCNSSWATSELSNQKVIIESCSLVHAGMGLHLHLSTRERHSPTLFFSKNLAVSRSAGQENLSWPKIIPPLWPTRSRCLGGRHIITHTAVWLETCGVDVLSGVLRTLWNRMVLSVSYQWVQPKLNIPLLAISFRMCQGICLLVM